MGKRLGQHFLFDPALLDRIVDAIDPQANDQVVEIGPGKGTLTERLALRVGAVVVIERDPQLALELREHVWENVTVVERDALRVDWSQSLPSPTSPFKVIGNIPYSITSPLLDRALEYRAVPLVVFLVQREVADRLTARPGSKAFGSLTVGVQTVMTVQPLFTVRRGAFSPPPKVDSALVRLIRRPEPLIDAAAQAGFRRFVTDLFTRRRKQLGRSLRSAAGAPGRSVVAVIESVGIDPSARVETLSPTQLVALFRAWQS